VFVLGRFFQASLIFESKVIAYQSGTYSLTKKYKTWLKRQNKLECFYKQIFSG
jgi:hypothetical protein